MKMLRLIAGGGGYSSPFCVPLTRSRTVED